MHALDIADAKEVFLQPGDLYFGDRNTRIRTVLGSCVSLVFWHPHLRKGGMCHYMLPSRAERNTTELDGRYADEAVWLMFHKMREAGTRPAEYQVKMFGGADMFPSQRSMAPNHIGLRNVEAARTIVKSHGLACICEHMAGVGHRNLIFDVWSGNVWVKHLSPVKAAQCGAPQPTTAQMCAA